MKILIVGGGGREHAIAWKLKNEGHELLCAPGNAGIEELAICFPVPATDVPGMVELAKREQPDFVLVTPDDPLALGMVDALEAKGIRAFGPRKAAARLEWSKAFSKQLMQKYHIPTASFRVFERMEEAFAYIDQNEPTFVVKADGLALGKGVLICETRGKAKSAVRSMMEDEMFGKAGRRVVIEEFLTGPEVSLLCFCDGKDFVLMPAAQDHKRAFEGDKGPNTGGMGAFAPTPKMTEALLQQTVDTIIKPTIDAMQAEGTPFKGVLYAGLMLTQRGPVVIEYNARFGDPETQPIMMLMQSSLADALCATIDGTLAQTEITFSDQAAVCVVLASGGYPGKYASGMAIEGIDEAERDGAVVFHAGTAFSDTSLVTAGGRVLGVTCTAGTMDSAIRKAYNAAGRISFESMQYRSDIGKT